MVVSVIFCYSVGLAYHGADPSWDHWRVDRWILNLIRALVLGALTWINSRLSRFSDLVWDLMTRDIEPVKKPLCNPGGWCFYRDDPCNHFFCEVKNDIIIPGPWFYE